MIQILVAIPFGFFLHRNWLKASLCYVFLFVSILAVESAFAPNEVLEVIRETDLAEHFLGMVQSWFGAGIGYIGSTVFDKITIKKVKASE